MVAEPEHKATVHGPSRDGQERMEHMMDLMWVVIAQLVVGI